MEPGGDPELGSKVRYSDPHYRLVSQADVNDVPVHPSQKIARSHSQGSKSSDRK